MIPIDLSSINPQMTIVIAWILTYLIHSTAFYVLVKLILLVKELKTSQTKEYLWRAALFGGIVTASLQTFSGFSFMSLPVVKTSQSSLDPAHETNAAPGPVIYHIDLNEAKARSAAGYNGIKSVPGSKPEIEISKPSFLSAKDPVVIVLASFLAISFCLILYKILAHYYFLYKLKPLNKVKDQIFQLTIFDLCISAGYRKKIQLRSSASLKSPIALGGNKIFVPQLSLKSFTEEQIKSLLAHELAHLQRRDTWWNWVYIIVESVLFFQPLNRIIRKELQENAELLCDEWAVKVTGDKKALASCILEVAGWYLKPVSSSVVAGMALRNKSLNHRINNILNIRSMKTKTNPAVTILGILAIGLLVLMATPGFTIAQQQGATQPGGPAHQEPGAPAQKPIVPADPTQTSKEDKKTGERTKDEIDLEIEVEEELDIERDINMDLDLDMDMGLYFPPAPGEFWNPLDNFNIHEDFSFYFNNEDFFHFPDSVFKNFEFNFDDHFKESFNFNFSFQDSDTNRIRSKASSVVITNDRKVVIENGEVKELWVDGKRIPDEEIKNHNIVIEDFRPNIVFQEEARIRSREAEMRSKEAELRAQEAEKRHAEALQRKEEIVIRRKEAEERHKEAQLRRVEAEERRKEAEERHKEAEARRKEAEKFNQVLEDSLLKDKLIESTQNYSFQLNNGELKVNDVKQPEKLHKKYKKLYESETGRSLKDNAGITIRKRQ